MPPIRIGRERERAFMKFKHNFVSTGIYQMVSNGIKMVSKWYQMKLT